MRRGKEEGVRDREPSQARDTSRTGLRVRESERERESETERQRAGRDNQ